jgi:hypothetical protein
MLSLAHTVDASGFLKNDVSIEYHDHQVSIRYSLWEVKLPINWVKSNPGINNLLDRKSSSAQALADPVARPLVVLLDAQGCFTKNKKSRYSLQEVKDLFDPLRSKWYASYYAHPVWNEFRKGVASKNGLLAWLVHNYHISRAAGNVAARMASANSKNQWAQFFVQDALDEYWHCDSFYSLRELHLPDLDKEYISTSVPLPGSLAFEEHALQVAESSVLGHLLIAYFQESSIAFKSDSHNFYESVERSYDLAGFFLPWKKHIQIDVEYGHADGLATLFESNTDVSSEDFECALRNAWLAFFFLYKSLDHIMAESKYTDIIRLRSANNPVFSHSPSLDTLSVEDISYLIEGLKKSSIRALGFSREHKEIIECGRAAKQISEIFGKEESYISSDPWCVAIVNHLNEIAFHPKTWLCLVDHLSKKLSCIQSISSQGSPPQGCTTEISVLDELICNCVYSEDLIPSDLLFQ